MEGTGNNSVCARRRLVVIVTVAILVVAGLVAVSVAIYWHTTGPPPLLTPPYMRLEALFEEPLGHGWGVDIPGYGPSLNLSSLQAHTLKRAAGDRHADMHQFFSPFPDQAACPSQGVCGQVRFTEAGLGRCMEALAARENAGLKTAACDEDSIMQMWQLDPYCSPTQTECPTAEPGIVEVAPNKTYAALEGRGQVKLARSGMQELCLTVGSKETEKKAGPYIRRDLLLQSCDPNNEAMVWSLVI